MKSLQQIGAAYEEIDASLEARRSDALDAGDTIATQRIEQKLLINDQAYFVLCWGQFEAEIEAACRAVIQRRQTNASWEMRRGFDFYSLGDKKLSGLSFREKVAIILNRKEEAYAKEMTYYDMRNPIAHGRLRATRIDVSEVVADFYSIQAELAR